MAATLLQEHYGNTRPEKLYRRQNPTPNTKCAKNLVPAQGLPEVLIDSGAPAIVMPAIIANAMGAAVGASIQDGTLSPVLCSVGDTNDKFTFGFGDKVNIDVPVAMMLVPLTNNDGKPLTSKAGQALCVFPVEINDNSAAMGSPFMQAAYIVYDMDRNQLLMAPAKINETESRIQEYVGA